MSRRRQKQRRDESEFDTLVATPHDFGNIAASASSVTNLVLPGNARLALSHSVALLQGGATVDVQDGLDWTHPALAAAVVHRGNYAERGKTVAIDRGTAVDAPAGTFTLYVVDGFGRHLSIGTATFT